MIKKILYFILIFILLSGCAYRGGNGHVNPDVRDYTKLIKVKETKNLQYRCSFSKIANQDFLKHGDYCEKPFNEDYVSYIVSYDTQQTEYIRIYLTQSSASYMGGNNYFKYYNIYAKNKSDMSLKYFNSVPPTSFAVQFEEDKYALGITKRDLLYRAVIKPTISIKELNPIFDKYGNIKDFEISYRISNYAFKINYSDKKIGELLGLPAYELFHDNENSKKNADLFNSILSEYWGTPLEHKQKKDSITAIDYALPQVGAPKFKAGLEGSFDISPSILGLITDYLPTYELFKITITNSEGEKQVYETNEIYNFLVNAKEDEALLNIYEKSKPINLTYFYKSNTPIRKGLSSELSEKIGLGYIYSDIADEISIDIHIADYFELDSLPYNCLGEDSKILRSIGNEKLDEYLSNMLVYKEATCNSNQTGIIKNLSKFFM